LYHGGASISGLTVSEDAYLEVVTGRSWTSARAYVPGFLVARETPAELDDIYYGESRVRADGARYDIRRVSNLTRTPQAHEVLLAQTEDTALFGVEVYGQTQALLLVDFGGDERDTSSVTSGFDRGRLAVSNLLNTGRSAGVGQRLYGLEPAPESVKVTVREGMYVVEVAAGTVELDPKTGDVTGGDHVRYQPRYFAQKAPVPWLVDTVRGSPWVGPRKIALLEKFVFGLRDRATRAAFAAGLVDETAGLRSDLEPDVLSDAFEFESGRRVATETWPPKPVRSAVPSPEPGEGQWRPAGAEWLRRLPGAPPAFYKTAVRMDADRPYEVVVLIAMDMRQLDLQMVAGTVNPHSSFGTRGDGTIPRDPEIIGRLVAAFNGGFQTGHGAFGMVVDRRTILPAMPYVATVTVQDDGHIEMGSWYNSMSVPEGVASLRQNLPPLISDGVFNPTNRRSRWGGTSSDLDLINTTRSGLGLCGEDSLIFAWCRSCSANSLGRAFIAARCSYGMHLDMNPTHTGWAWYRADLAGGGDKPSISNLQSAKGAARMDFRTNRYIERDVKDFFYLTLRRDFASTLGASPSGFGPWSTEHSPRGRAGFLPFAATSRNADGTFLVAVDSARVSVRLRRGDDEPDPTGTMEPDLPIKMLSDAVVVDVGLGGVDGFVFEGRILAPIPKGRAGLLVQNGALSLVGNAATVPGGTVRGGRLLVQEGRIVKPEPSGGPVRAMAIVGQTYFFAEGADEEQVAEALVGVGAVQAIQLGRAVRRAPMAFVRDGLEVAPVTGDASAFDPSRRSTSHLYIEVQADAPRTRRLALEDVELSEEESRRQRRLQGQIKAARQELREIQNLRYKAWKAKSAAE
jgi:hypothetical protein